jgi:hypothetical protein
LDVECGFSIRFRTKGYNPIVITRRQRFGIRHPEATKGPFLYESTMSYVFQPWQLFCRQRLQRPARVGPTRHRQSNSVTHPAGIVDGVVKITVSMPPSARGLTVEPVMVEKPVADLRAVRRENKAAAVDQSPSCEPRPLHALRV